MKNTYKITYDHGLHEDIIVEAEDEAAAKREAVAAYRKDSGSVEVLSFSSADFIIKAITKVN